MEKEDSHGNSEEEPASGTWHHAENNANFVSALFGPVLSFSGVMAWPLQLLPSTIRTEIITGRIFWFGQLLKIMYCVSGPEKMPPRIN